MAALGVSESFDEILILLGLFFGVLLVAFAVLLSDFYIGVVGAALIALAVVHWLTVREREKQMRRLLQHELARGRTGTYT